MKKQLLILFSIFYFLKIDITISQQTDNDFEISFFSDVYNYNPIKAKKKLLLNAKQISKQEFYFLQANLKWWQLLNGQNDTENINSCENNIKKSINFYESNDDKQLKQKFLLLSSYVLRMRLHNLGESKLKTGFDLLKVIKLSNELLKIMPDSDRKNFIEGLYYYMLAQAKEQSFIGSIFLYNYEGKGKDKGLKLLEKATDSEDIIIKTESLYVLYKIYADIENDYPKAKQKINTLVVAYSDNIFFQVEFYKMLIKNNLVDASKSYKIFILQKIDKNDILIPAQKQYFKRLLDNYCKNCKI